MPRADELLVDPHIKRWLESHEGAGDKVRRAAELLAGQPDDLEALTRLLPALNDRTVYVFFSYKAKDERAAREVVRLLRTYSAEKLKITYQADFTREIVGRQWRDKIKEEVCRANWFILLFPDPSDDWDWCLYEAGLFDRQTTSAHRVICLHHPDTEIPDPIKDYHHVPATVPKVEEFLRMVYLEPDPIPGLPPLNRAAEGVIPELATKIVEAIRPPAGRRHHEIFEPWIELAVEGADRLGSRDDLDPATIESANQQALALFDFSQRPRTWGQLRSYVKEGQGDSRWREEMFHVIRRIAQGRRFYPIQAVFQARNGQVYRPVVHGVDRVSRSGQILSFHITFAEDVAAIDSSAMPLQVANLATVLRFVFRFRWEILEKFGGQPMTIEDVERLDNAFRRMQKDWESRGGLEPVRILELFPEDRRQRVLEMFVSWGTVRNKNGTGDLDLAIAAKNPKACSEILERFLPLNQEFLELAADRFNEAISAH